jgi:hypothetical protein
MYRIPQSLDLEDIIGSDIQQIFLGRYDVQFCFGSNTRIAVQSRVTLIEGEMIIAAWDEKRNWTTLEFQRLLNEKVEGYYVPNDQTLEVRFSSGLVLQLHDDSDQFESMQIYPLGDIVGQIVI